VLRYDRRVRVVGLTAVACAACGRIAFDPVAVDATSDAYVPTPFEIHIEGADSAVRAVAATGDGGAVIAGWSLGAVTIGGVPIGRASRQDAIVAAVDRDGNVRWAMSFGTANVTRARGIAVGADGNVYVAGDFNGTIDFGGLPLVSNATDGYVASFTADGAYRWAIKIAGDQPDGTFNGDQINAIAAMGSGDLVVGGATRGTVDFGNGLVVASPGASESAAMVARVSSADGTVPWAKLWGTSSTALI
jgi:hypothetical protein